MPQVYPNFWDEIENWSIFLCFHTKQLFNQSLSKFFLKFRRLDRLIKGGFAKQLRPVTDNHTIGGPGQLLHCNYWKHRTVINNFELQKTSRSHSFDQKEGCLLIILLDFRSNSGSGSSGERIILHWSPSMKDLKLI